MQDAIIAVALGAASGVLGTIAFRFRLAWLGWLALTPLTAAVHLFSPLAAGLAGVTCGLLLAAANRLVAIPPSIPGVRSQPCTTRPAESGRRRTAGTAR
jgi:hypothetical protein